MATNTAHNKRPQTHAQREGYLAWLAALRHELPGFLGPLLGFSVVVNLLLLVAPLYMLQTYDRVLTSGSTDTLIWLTVIAVFLLGIYAVAEAGRKRITALAAETIEEVFSQRSFARFEQQSDNANQLSNDLAYLGRVRALFQNQLIMPFVDTPFVPFFLLVLFLVHPVIGTLGLIGGILVFAVAAVAEVTTRTLNQEAIVVSNQAHQLANGLARQRSAMVAMGLIQNAQRKWQATKSHARQLSLEASAKEGAFSGSARALRQILQILVLGTGAALAIAQEISPGAIVAASIVLSRALAPIDQIVGSWRAITQARAAWDLLQDVREMPADKQHFTALPRPTTALTIERLTVQTPGQEEPLIRPFSIDLHGGQFISVVGGNGAGKTSLLQTLAGAWQPGSGRVSLGARPLHQWSSEDRGQYVGYVPQDVELLPGTIGENIARMSDAEAAPIIEAATKAGAHEMILALPQGYETPLLQSGDIGLSAGQRQMIGLARALFNNPVLLLLDEPTANLDVQTAARVTDQLKSAAANNTIVIVATHDQAVIEASENRLLLKNGAVMAAQPTTKAPSFTPPRSIQKSAQHGARA